MSDQIVRTPVTDGCYIGLDMSLTGSGFCRKENGEIIFETIKTTPKTAANDLARYRYITNEAMRRIPMNTKLICIEDVFTATAKFQIGASVVLHQLAAVVRMALYEKGLPFYIVAAMSLKKHILGKGSGQKSLVIREVYKKYGIDTTDDNQADAIVLAHLAEHLYSAMNGIPYKATKAQDEVVFKLIQTKGERGYNLKVRTERPHYNIPGVD